MPKAVIDVDDLKTYFRTEEGVVRAVDGVDLEIRTGEHPFLPVQAFYVDDPDGNEVEIVARLAQP